MKKRCVGRRGQFFLIDSILALSVLVVGAFLIFSLYVKNPSKEEATIFSEDVMDFFTRNKIKDINNPYAGLNGELWNNGEIDNAENTLLQQVAEFYENGKLDIAEKFIVNLTENTLPQQYKFEFWISDGTDNKLLYPKEPSAEHLKSKNNAKVLIPSKKIVYGFSNRETGDMFGPYTVEVLVWQ